MDFAAAIDKKKKKKKGIEIPQALGMNAVFTPEFCWSLSLSVHDHPGCPFVILVHLRRSFSELVGS